MRWRIRALSKLAELRGWVGDCCKGSHDEPEAGTRQGRKAEQAGLALARPATQSRSDLARAPLSFFLSLPPLAHLHTTFIIITKMGAKWTEPELAQLDKSAQKHADNHKGSGPLLMPSKTFITKEFYAAFPTSTRTSRAVEVLFDKRFSLGGKHGEKTFGADDDATPAN